MEGQDGSPCHNRECLFFWVSIREEGGLGSQLPKAWCVVGDFNSIRIREGRKTLVSVSDYSKEIDGFNAFIEKTELIDIPLTSRKFTWYKPNGLVKSRINRVLVSKEWVEAWPHCK